MGGRFQCTRQECQSREAVQVVVRQACKLCWPLHKSALLMSMSYSMRFDMECCPLSIFSHLKCLDIAAQCRAQGKDGGTIEKTCAKTFYRCGVFTHEPCNLLDTCRQQCRTGEWWCTSRNDALILSRVCICRF